MSKAPDAPSVLLANDFHLRYGTRLAAGLDRAGARVALLTRDHDLEFGGEPGAARAFIAATVGPEVTVRRIEGRVRSPRGWEQALALRHRLAAFRRGVVHLQQGICNDLRLGLTSGLRRGAYAVTVHDPVPHPGDVRYTALEKIDRALTRRAGLVFVHGEALKEELEAVVAPAAPIVVVPHGVSGGESAPLPAEPAILFFGRISYYKGLDVLLDAMAAVWAALPTTTLTIAGDGEIEDHPALADPRVSVLGGYIPDSRVPALIEAATCVALPYRQASQSGVGSLVKPFARPLVVTTVGGLPELVADGSGLAVPPADPAALGAALVSVLSDRDLATRLGAAGAATATAGASWDTVARLTLDAYREYLPAIAASNRSS